MTRFDKFTEEFVQEHQAKLTQNKRGRSTGRTTDFDSVNRGSIPRPATKYSHMASIFKGMGLPEPVFEHKFHPTRKWRMDIAFPNQKVFIEIQGGIWTQGRHNRGEAMLKEWEKLNTSVSMGWRPLFTQPVDLTKPNFLEMVKQTIEIAEYPIL